MENSEKVRQYLKEMNINFKIFQHPKVYTCKQAEKYSNKIKGIRSKNLFLKGKKSNKYYLLIIPEKEKLDAKKLKIIINEEAGFATQEELKQILNLETGAVSPFGLINDKEAKTTLLIDKRVWDSDFVSFHPNINTETIELARDDFQRFIITTKNKRYLF